VKSLCISLLLLVIYNNAMALEVSPTKNPDTGMLSWLVDEPKVSLKLIQLLPDYVTAVFSSRGLPPQVVDTLKDYCVFGTIIKNKSSGTLAYRIADWRYVTPDGNEHALKTKTEWVKQWKVMGSPYRWLFLPDDQTFAIGDWSQGFTTLKLPPNSTFNLNYSWRYQGETHQRTLKNLRCAPTQTASSIKG